MTNRILLTFFVTALPLAGQTREYGPVSLELPQSTRAMAMGGTFQLTDPGSDGIFYNPSLLVEDTRFGLSRTSFNSEATFLTMSASTGWWGGGVWADVFFGIRQMHHIVSWRSDDAQSAF